MLSGFALVGAAWLIDYILRLRVAPLQVRFGAAVLVLALWGGAILEVYDDLFKSLIDWLVY